MTVDEQLQRARDLLDERFLTAQRTAAGEDVRRLQRAILELLDAIEQLADRAA